MLPVLLFSLLLHAHGSLDLTAHTYAVIRFHAESAPKKDIPSQITFSTAGTAPPGMVFESYPCHRPGEKNCAALASADGIYLDGTPTRPGAYRIRITAKDLQGATVSREFMVTVKR